MRAFYELTRYQRLPLTPTAGLLIYVCRRWGDFCVPWQFSEQLMLQALRLSLARKLVKRVSSREPALLLLAQPLVVSLHRKGLSEHTCSKRMLRTLR